jgi:hypothetical protein
MIATNILLVPDAATVAKAQATNARLRADYPRGFALDADHTPHITLLQRVVRTGRSRPGREGRGRRLQQRIIDAVAPFALAKGTAEAFAPRPDGGAIGQPTVDYVNDFVGPRTGVNYHPRLRRDRHARLRGRFEGRAVRALHRPGRVGEPLPGGGLRCRTEKAR